ncbi:hypothetical protein AZE42_07667 [Rhizopogon vesiculosus]|uniref:F-box domain-containing protein n=1 Tax=Rhizopogon vesiculosus TaxID=180088 RepID=A0A1J8QEN4_9AGAM|nr:hypothetical protein AZE42_07667 [Rhizopogon vesiculosus]
MVSSAVRINDLPAEVLEHILLISDPFDVARASQVCRLFRGLVYADDEHFWRALYLAQPFDDPREAVTYLGNHRTGIKWREELQRIIRARTVVHNVTVCRPEERCQVLRTLLDMVTNIPPLPFPESEPTSHNVLWMQTLLQDGAFLDLESQSHEERQLRARLHTWFGLTDRDGLAAKRIDSRAYVYSQRNYRSLNSFGPYALDGSGLVNWEHMQKLAHVFARNLVEREEEEEEEGEEEVAFEVCSLSLAFCQAVIPPGLDLDRESDWAGVEGLWRISYCFMDHRELLIYNDLNSPEDVPLDHAIFEDAKETFSSINLFIRVINVEQDPDHPTRPKINYVGEMDGNFSIVGYVKLTPDNQIRWHFVAGNGDQGRAVWCGEAISMGNVRSRYGVLGAWSTTLHDPQDPIGAHDCGERLLQRLIYDLLIVCLGNICRSPMGEAVLRNEALKRGITDIHVDSAGTASAHVGDDPDERTITVCSTNDVPISHSARQVRARDFSSFDYILAADASNLRSLERHPGRSEESKAAVKLWGSYLPDNKPIQDPYYGGLGGFTKCYEQCVKLSNAFLDEVVGKKD